MKNTNESEEYKRSRDAELIAKKREIQKAIKNTGYQNCFCYNCKLPINSTNYTLKKVKKDEPITGSYRGYRILHKECWSRRYKVPDIPERDIDPEVLSKIYSDKRKRYTKQKVHDNSAVEYHRAISRLDYINKMEQKKLMKHIGLDKFQCAICTDEIFDKKDFNLKHVTIKENVEKHMPFLTPNMKYFIVCKHRLHRKTDVLTLNQKQVVQTSLSQYLH